MISNINIHTTLAACPPPRKHEILVITRGATTSLNFSFSDKVYGLENVDQLTIILRQGKAIHWYNMVDYFMVSKDTVVDGGKKYYNKVPSNIAGKAPFKFVEIADPQGNPSEQEYYESCDLADGIVTEDWQFDDHFYYFKGPSYEYLNFILGSNETAQFNVTQPDCLMEYEVAVRLNTDEIEGMHGRDSVIITPQHPIAVVDSLYSRIPQSSTGDVVVKPIASENTYCSETLYCND